MALRPEHKSRTRTFAHPGRYNPVRVNCLTSNAGKHIRLYLEPGICLYDGLVKPLATMGISSASTTVFGGYFSSLDYCVAPPDPKGEAVIAYSAPINAGQTYMIFGNATLGESSDGIPMVHCHATIRTKDGFIKGGHIITESAIVADRPISVLVTSIDDFMIKQTFDQETNIQLFQPTQRDHYV